MKLADWYDKELTRIEQHKAEEREIAALSRISIDEYDADVTAQDPCIETP